MAEAARQQYLAAASEALMLSSPAISSYLQTVNEQHVGHPQSCSACGSTMLLGWSCTKITTKAHTRTRRDRMSGTSKAATTTLECLRCSSVTTVVERGLRRSKNAKLDRSGKLPLVSHEQPLRAPKSAMGKAEARAPSAAGSKKRGRGKKSSLQAMLADRKTTGTSSGFGLSLDDFMK
ncbi:uncharacterized protein MYCFIDRAFT_212380 [Pseudocercospora fijiensis CIRAD86]|uniref:Uncharacterized protein n=1 Tax=Pseudocercospora fijiensis (strain CIRAD86) TaxID=383855 RepID=M2ZH04_PSEFD|nr:uncharacterized protein MYCFIDRAFT_212380 [Pseudocercospora fijiensis CIRAD86]EME78424.1 hypothetical protein MYCFIDRAFT_212380 [Pseudocercospora fijiensis CIRAD86]